MTLHEPTDILTQLWVGTPVKITNKLFPFFFKTNHTAAPPKRGHMAWKSADKASTICKISNFACACHHCHHFHWSSSMSVDDGCRITSFLQLKQSPRWWQRWSHLDPHDGCNCSHDSWWKATMPTIGLGLSKRGMHQCWTDRHYKVCCWVVVSIAWCGVRTSDWTCRHENCFHPWCWLVQLLASMDVLHSHACCCSSHFSGQCWSHAQNNRTSLGTIFSLGHLFSCFFGPGCGNPSDLCLQQWLQC